jgi:plasmid stabilization system protein ParE
MKPKAGKKTLWSLEAINELRDIYLYIKRDSSAQAIRVKEG